MLTSENYFGKYAQASNITVTGSGFPWGQTLITVGLIVTSTTVSSSTVLSNALCLTNPSMGPTSEQCYSADGDNGVKTVTADANGYFQAQFQVPSVEGSPAAAYNVAATYFTSGGYVVSNIVPFDVVPAAAVFSDVTGASSGTYNTRVDIEAAGFAAGEAIDIIPSTSFLVTQPWGSTAVTSFFADSSGTTAGDACAYPSTVGDFATYVTCDGGFLTDRPQGTFTVALLGSISGNRVTTTFSAAPSIEFSTSGVSTFALTSSPNTADFVVHNFPEQTMLPANNLTLGGVSTIQSGKSTNDEGLAGPIPFTYTRGLPAGLLSAAFDGMTFSYANGNIVAPPALETFQDGEEDTQAGILIATTSALSFVTMDQSTYAVDDYAYLFGICAPLGSSCGTPGVFTGVAGQPTAKYYTALSGQTQEQYSITTSSTISFTGTNPVLNLASVGETVYAAGESENAISSGQLAYWLAFAVPYSYGGSSTTTLAVSTMGATTAAPPAVSFSIAPSVWEIQGVTYGTYWSSDVATVDNSFNTVTIAVTGFNSSDPTVANPSASVYLGGNFWFACTESAGAWSFNSTYPGTATCDIPATSPIPDVASGSYTVWVNGTATDNYASWSLTVEPLAESTSLTSYTGATAGTRVGILTATGAGIHGLAASTVYTVEYSGTSVATFTSTATGQVPPGVQFALPAGISGAHIVDLVASSGTSVFYGAQVSTLQQYTNLIITSAGDLALTPTAGNVGSMVTLSGSGLGAGTAYYVWVPLCPPGGGACSSTYVSYASFTTDASGAIPPGSGTFAWPSMPTDPDSSTCAGFPTTYEAGTLVTAYAAARSSDIPPASSPSAPVGTARFFLEALLTFTNSSVQAAGSVSYRTTGLCATTAYYLVFNYALTSAGTAFTGTTVGSFVSSSDGEASGTFTVPASAGAGDYPVQLVRVGGSGAAPNLGVLSAAPSLTVGAPATTGLTTNTFVPTGSASEALVSGQATLSQTYTNSYTSPLSVYVWVDVLDSAGQSVGVFLGSATVGAGQSASIAAVLFDLPAGGYTATVFATTTAGIVISKTSTPSITV